MYIIVYIILYMYIIHYSVYNLYIHIIMHYNNNIFMYMCKVWMDIFGMSQETVAGQYTEIGRRAVFAGMCM